MLTLVRVVVGVFQYGLGNQEVGKHRHERGKRARVDVVLGVQSVQTYAPPLNTKVARQEPYAVGNLKWTNHGVCSGCKEAKNHFTFTHLLQSENAVLDHKLSQD